MLYFKDILAGLMERHDIPKSQQPTFRARTRNLFRAGLPSPKGCRGVGRRANFSEQDARVLIYTMEICSLGIPPEKAVVLVNEHLDRLEELARVGGDLRLEPPSAFGGSPTSALIISVPKLH